MLHRDTASYEYSITGSVFITFVVVSVTVDLFGNTYNCHHTDIKVLITNKTMFNICGSISQDVGVY